MAVTRLALYGGPRSPYGSFAGKTEAEVVVVAEAEVVVVAVEGDVAGRISNQLQREEEELLGMVWALAYEQR